MLVPRPCAYQVHTVHTLTHIPKQVAVLRGTGRYREDWKDARDGHAAEGWPRRFEIPFCNHGHHLRCNTIPARRRLRHGRQAGAGTLLSTSSTMQFMPNKLIAGVSSPACILCSAGTLNCLDPVPSFCLLLASEHFGAIEHFGALLILKRASR